MRSMKVHALKIWAIVGLAAMVLAGSGIMFAAGRQDPPEKKADPPKAVNPPAVAKTDTTMWKEKTVLEMPGWLASSPDSRVSRFSRVQRKVAWPHLLPPQPRNDFRASFPVLRKTGPNVLRM